MKRFYTLFLAFFLCVCTYAQSFKAYIQVTYSSVPRTVSIIIGDTAVIPKDAKGQPLKFNTIVAVLNWLSKKGWHVEPVMLNSSSQQSQTFLMSRDNTTDKELSAMFK